MQSLYHYLRPLVVAMFAILSLSSVEARADDVATVKLMLQKAVETEDKVSFDAVLNMAIVTWPKNREEILVMAQSLQEKWLEATYVEEIEEVEIAAAEAEAVSRARGIIYFLDPELWNAKAEFGAGSSTGDTDEKSLSFGLNFHRNFGPLWEHDLDFAFNFVSSTGVTKRQKFVTQYEAIWRPWKSAFLLNYTELELDRFSGYDYRLVENIALGANLIDNGTYKLRLEGGPGLRFSKLGDTGVRGTEFLGRFSTTFDWKITDTVSFRDRMSVIFATESTTVANDVRFSTRINSYMSARLSFDVKYDSAPPLNTSAWDTSTRATFVFGF